MNLKILENDITPVPTILRLPLPSYHTLLTGLSPCVHSFNAVISHRHMGGERGIGREIESQIDEKRVKDMRGIKSACFSSIRTHGICRNDAQAHTISSELLSQMSMVYLIVLFSPIMEISRLCPHLSEIDYSSRLTLACHQCVLTDPL